MIFWLESQPVPVIVAIGFMLCFSMAAATFIVGWLLSRTRFADDLSFITPTLLTPLGVILGLLLVFLSSRVWTNVDRANMAASQEATAIQELRRVADELPLSVADPIRDGVSVYFKWVQQDDWPSMMSGNGSLGARLPGLAEAMKALVNYNATISGQRNVQEAALAAIGKVRDARRARILQSRSFIGPAQWLVVLVLYFHLLLLISTVHIKRRVTMAVALWIFSSAFAACFVLLLMYDRPFRSGGLTVGFVGIESPVVE
jgi:Protein of unknown function (DUF4239)